MTPINRAIAISGAAGAVMVALDATHRALDMALVARACGEAMPIDQIQNSLDCLRQLSSTLQDDLNSFAKATQ